MYKRLSDRYNNQNNHESEMTEDLDLNSIIVVGSGHIPGKISLDATQKVLYYLVSCMNLAFPDFDFR